MDILQIVALLFLFLITLAIVVIAIVFVIMFLLDRAKNVDYLQKQYVDMIKFTEENCPDSLFGYELRVGTNSKVEGRALGTIFGYYHGEVFNEKKNKSEFRHFFTFLPIKNEFKFWKPDTWTPKKRIAIAKEEDLEGPPGGNVRWNAMPEFFKWFIYNVADEIVDKPCLAKKISSDVALEVGLEGWRSVAKFAHEAAESDTGTMKGIRVMSESNTRRSN